MGYFLGCLSGVRSSPAIVEAEVKLDSIRSVGIWAFARQKYLRYTEETIP